jgi:hypothetical protein
MQYGYRKIIAYLNKKNRLATADKKDKKKRAG